MTHYIRSVNSFRVTDNVSTKVYDQLPVGTYIINQDQYGNFFLDLIDDFQQQNKIYGNTLRHADRILGTYADRSASTGVMLTGEKGSGKSLLAKTLSVKAREQGIATIVINRPWCGDGFNKLMQDINQPIVVLFDEFEKVYDRDSQEAILTLFDGMFPTKKLFVLTCNDKWRVDQHMRNRPGRIFYMLEFKGLDPDFIKEYCEENLKNQDHLPGILRVSSLFGEFNFDMLKAMVEEMNRYNETAHEVMALLNTRPEYGNDLQYDITVSVDGVPIDAEDLNDKSWSGNPLSNQIGVGFHMPVENEDDESEWRYEIVTPGDLRSVDGTGSKLIYQRDDLTVVLNRRKERQLDLSQLY